MAAAGVGEPTGTISRLRTKVGMYASSGMRSSSSMFGTTAVSSCCIAQPLIQAVIGNRWPFHSGAIASSSA